MLWKEKIRQMNDDELAEFIGNCTECGGFDDLACRACKHNREDGTCSSKDRHNDCLNATKNMLNSEV